MLILANTVLMMLERHPMPAYEAEIIELGNLAFFAAYSFEMLLKLVALGCSRYWAEPFNCFDGVVVLMSAAEIATTTLRFELGLNAQALRAFRLLRIFKLARQWRSLSVVIQSLLTTLVAVRDLIIVLVLTLFVFALLGMQVCAHVYVSCVVRVRVCRACACACACACVRVCVCVRACMRVARCMSRA